MSSLFVKAPVVSSQNIVESKSTRGLPPEVVDSILHEVVRARDEDFVRARRPKYGFMSEDSSYLASMRLLNRTMERIAGDGHLAINQNRLEGSRQHETWARAASRCAPAPNRLFSRALAASEVLHLPAVNNATEMREVASAVKATGVRPVGLRFNSFDDVPLENLRLDWPTLSYVEAMGRHHSSRDADVENYLRQQRVVDVHVPWFWTLFLPRASAAAAPFPWVKQITLDSYPGAIDLQSHVAARALSRLLPNLEFLALERSSRHELPLFEALPRLPHLRALSLFDPDYEGLASWAQLLTSLPRSTVTWLALEDYNYTRFTAELAPLLRHVETLVLLNSSIVAPLTGVEPTAQRLFPPLLEVLLANPQLTTVVFVRSLVHRDMLQTNERYACEVQHPMWPEFRRQYADQLQALPRLSPFRWQPAFLRPKPSARSTSAPV